jgi:hypothetical protein
MDMLGHFVAYLLHIRTHGRLYTEPYESLDEAIEAALALEEEPRERADHISLDGAQCVSREQLDELLRVRADRAP